MIRNDSGSVASCMWPQGPGSIPNSCGGLGWGATIRLLPRPVAPGTSPYSEPEVKALLLTITALRDANDLEAARTIVAESRARYRTSVPFLRLALDVAYRSGALQLAQNLVQDCLFVTEMPPLAVAHRVRDGASLISIYPSIERSIEHVEPIITNAGLGYLPLRIRSDQEAILASLELIEGVELVQQNDRDGALYYLKRSWNRDASNPLLAWSLGKFYSDTLRREEALPLIRVAFANSEGDFRAMVGRRLRRLTDGREGLIP